MADCDSDPPIPAISCCVLFAPPKFHTTPSKQRRPSNCAIPSKKPVCTRPRLLSTPLCAPKRLRHRFSFTSPAFFQRAGREPLPTACLSSSRKRRSASSRAGEKLMPFGVRLSFRRTASPTHSTMDLPLLPGFLTTDIFLPPPSKTSFRGTGQ